MRSSHDRTCAHVTMQHIQACRQQACARDRDLNTPNSSCKNTEADMSKWQSHYLFAAPRQLAEPLPILGNNTTSQPIRRLFLYSPLHLNNYITTTSPLPIPV